MDATTDLTKGKEREFPFSSFLNHILNQKDLEARWQFNIGTGWTVKNYSFSGAQRVCHEHFEESCFEAELQTQPGAVPTIFHFNPTHVQQEKRKGPEAHTKESKICYIKLL